MMTQCIKGPSSEKLDAAAEAPRQALAGLDGLDGRRASISIPNAPGHAGSNLVVTYM